MKFYSGSAGRGSPGLFHLQPLDERVTFLDTMQRALPFIIVIGLLAALAAGGSRAQNAKASIDKKDCRQLVEAIGYPSGPEQGKTFVCHTGFALLHNDANKTSEWVVERLKGAELTGRFERPQIGFEPELAVQPEGARAVDADYKGTKKHPSKFDRGHLAPSEDFNNSCELMKETFVLSNVVPQIGAKFNRTIWARLEAEVRGIAKERGDVYVITGPVPRKAGGVRTIKKADNDCNNEIRLDGSPQKAICEAKNKNPKKNCVNGVVVPIALYKIIYDPQQQIAYAYVLPNRDHPNKSGATALSYFDGFRTTVAILQNETGLKFFDDLPDDVRKKVVDNCTKDRPWANPDKSPPKGSVCQ
jgi:endonuclease G